MKSLGRVIVYKSTRILYWNGGSGNSFLRQFDRLKSSKRRDFSLWQLQLLYLSQGDFFFEFLHTFMTYGLAFAISFLPSYRPESLCLCHIWPAYYVLGLLLLHTGEKVFLLSISFFFSMAHFMCNGTRIYWLSTWANFVTPRVVLLDCHQNSNTSSTISSLKWVQIVPPLCRFCPLGFVRPFSYFTHLRLTISRDPWYSRKVRIIHLSA